MVNCRHNGKTHGKQGRPSGNMKTAELSIIDYVRDTIRSVDGAVIHYDPATEGPSRGIFEAVEGLPLCDDVRTFVSMSYPHGLFRHQRAAVDHVLAGRNTVVATRTSSGKSLIYSLPALDTLCRDSRATGLFLYPQKALANDQLMKLRTAVDAIPALRAASAGRPHFVSRYDGATPSEPRPRIRQEAQIVLTNPDMLHFALLQYHERHWARFFGNLKHVVIDECHEYRGIFGTNVGYILRRLRQACALHRSAPTFIATSATIREPREHLEKLTGARFTCVGPEMDGSRQGRRKYWMVSGREHFYDFGRKLALKLAEQGLTVLAFCPGRVAAERMMARMLAAKDGEIPWVRVYRAGLSAAEREEIEQGLRDKSVRLVFSTSALELGIDIGEIDVVVCIGLPNSMMSLWQRGGRAARAGKEGAVVLVPGDTPIDTYYAGHPQELFSKDNEPLVLNLNNRRVVCQHYACANAEVGGDEDRLDTDILGEAAGAVRNLRAQGRLDLDVFYRSDPHMQINIRSIGEGNYSLEQGNEVVGEIDEFHLLREAYRNAIYRHGGRRYRVKDVIRGRRKVLLEREYTWNETTPYIQKKIRLKRRLDVADYKDIMVATVRIDVTEFLVSVVEKDRTGNTVNVWNGNAGMPTHPLPTEGTMLLLRQPLWAAILSELGQPSAKSALQSCERLLWSLFPTISGPCDKQDFSSASEILPDGQAAIYLYDLVYDGVDLTTAAFDRMCELVQKATERIDNCACDTDQGCFCCIANPRYPEPTSKAGTARLLDAIKSTVCCAEPHVVRNSDGENPIEDNQTLACPSCGEKFKAGDRFCSNCGQKLEA